MRTTHTRHHLNSFRLFFLVLTCAAMTLITSTAQAQCGPMDVVFVLDDTSSMGRSLANIKTDLNAILDKIQTASNNDYRLALVTFKDDVTVHETFSVSNRESISQKILALSAEGGSSIPEASDEALNTVINNLSAAGRPQINDFNTPFRDQVYKLVILLTDAVPGGFDDTFEPGVDDVNARNFAQQAKAKNIKIAAIYVPTFPNNTPTIKPIMEAFATVTGSFYLETAQDGTGTADAINKITESCGFTPIPQERIVGLPSPHKTGSVLFYNIFTSDITAPRTENTQLNLTNTDENLAVLVRLFVVDSSTCQVEDMFFCLRPTKHISLLASEIDPGIKGFAIAIAIDNEGKPIRFNALSGTQFVKLKSGHQAQIGALAFAAFSDSPAKYDEEGDTFKLDFDGISYDLSPRILAVNNIASPVDGHSTFLVLNKFGGDLTNTSSVGKFSDLIALFYDNSERVSNVTLAGQACQTLREIKDGYPRMIPRLTQTLTAGKLGWMQLSASDGSSLVGATFSYHPTAIRTGGNNLPYISLTDQASYVIKKKVPILTCQ